MQFDGVVPDAADSYTDPFDPPAEAASSGNRAPKITITPPSTRDITMAHPPPAPRAQDAVNHTFTHGGGAFDKTGLATAQVAARRYLRMPPPKSMSGEAKPL